MQHRNHNLPIASFHCWQTNRNHSTFQQNTLHPTPIYISKCFTQKLATIIRTIVQYITCFVELSHSSIYNRIWPVSSTPQLKFLFIIRHCKKSYFVLKEWLTTFGKMIQNCIKTPAKLIRLTKVWLCCKAKSTHLRIPMVPNLNQSNWVVFEVLENLCIYHIQWFLDSNFGVSKWNSVFLNQYLLKNEFQEILFQKVIKICFVNVIIFFG